MVCYLTGELIFIEHILHTWYCSETLDDLTHLILKMVLWFSSYLDHTYTDSDDANIQEIGLKPHCCFFIASLEKNYKYKLYRCIIQLYQEVYLGR